MIYDEGSRATARRSKVTTNDFKQNSAFNNDRVTAIMERIAQDTPANKKVARSMFAKDLMKIARIDALRQIVKRDEGIKINGDDRMFDLRQPNIGAARAGTNPDDGCKLVVKMTPFKNKADIVKLVDEQVVRHARRIEGASTEWDSSRILDELFSPDNKKASRNLPPLIIDSTDERPSRFKYVPIFAEAGDMSNETESESDFDVDEFDGE